MTTHEILLACASVPKTFKPNAQRYAGRLRKRGWLASEGLPRASGGKGGRPKEEFIATNQGLKKLEYYNRVGCERVACKICEGDNASKEIPTSERDTEVIGSSGKRKKTTFRVVPTDGDEAD